jgi:hypothetical protein
MPEHRQLGEDAVVNPETRHEESDVNVRSLLWFIVIFVVFAAVMHVALFILFKFFVQIEKGATSAPMTQIAVSPDANVPSVPRLQPFPTKGARGETASPVASTPLADLGEMRAQEQQVLDHYGWVDQQKGIVHIPIEQAKQLALQRGFAVNTATAAPAAAPAPPAKPPASTQDDSNPARVGSTTDTGIAKP